MTTTGPLRAISAPSLALLVATAAVSQTTSENDSVNSNDWEFKLAPLYIWFAGIGGDAGLGPAGALVGWQFNKWGALNAGYKWLAYDYETGSGLSRFSWDVT